MSRDTLTREEILSASGPQLNEMIDKMLNYKHIAGDFPNWSGDIKAAWEVVEKMDSNKWDIKIIKSGKYNEVTFGDTTVIRVNVSEAICKAALLAVME